MDGQDYYNQLFASFNDEEKKKKPNFLDTLDEAQRFSSSTPGYEENIAGVTRAAPYEGAPAQNWIPKDMAQAFKKAIELSDNPSETETRLNTAYYLSQQKGISFDEAFRNMDDILAHDYAVNMSPESGFAAVRDAFNAQMVNRMIYPLTYELKDKLLKGTYKTWDQVEADPLYQKIQGYEKLLPPEDARKRNLGTNFLKSVVQVVPSFVEAATVGALVGAAAYATAGAALPALGAALPGVFGMGEAMLAGGSLVSTVPTIASMFASVTGAAATTADMRVMEGGGAFYDMMKFKDPTTGARYNPEIAAKMSTWYEGVSNAIELFQVGELLDGFTDILSKAQLRALKESFQASISNIGDAATRAGGFMKAVNSTIGKFLVEWGYGTLEESAQETIQEGANVFFEEVAKTWTNRLDGTSIAPATKKEIQDRLVNTFVTSLQGMGVTELLPSGVKIFRDTREAAHEAVSDTLWEKMKDITTPGTPKADAAPTSPESPATPAEPGKPVYFKIYEPDPGVIEVRGTTEATGSERKSSVIVSAAVDDGTKTVTIGRIGVAKDLRENPTEAIRQGVEAIRNLAGSFEGYSISLDPKNDFSTRIKSALGPDFFNAATPSKAAPAAQREPAPAEGAAAPEQPRPQEVPEAQNIPEPPTSNSPASTINPGQDESAPQEASNITPEAQNAAPTQFKAPVQGDMEPAFQEQATGLEELQSQGAARVESTLEGNYKYIAESNFPVQKIEYSQELPQFKEGANKEGVVNPITGAPEPMGMPPLVLYETKDGHYYIVTGRHRLDLWKRNGLPTIPAHIVKESDGYSLADMSVIDAEMNIRDNQGKEIDYARYFARTQYTYEAAERRGLLRTSKAQSGFYIGTAASPALQALYYSSKITGEKAAAIASAAPNDAELQSVGIRLAADKSNTPESIHNALTLYAQTKRGDSSQADLFGMNDDELLKMQLKISKAAEQIKGDIKGELGVLKQALRLGEKDRLKFIEKYGYKMGDRTQIATRIDELNDLATRWEGWSQDPELFAQARAQVESADTALVSDTTPEYGPSGSRVGNSAFKAWFGGSKAVDENGDPIIVYHGSQRADRVGSSFKRSRATSGPMAYFTDSPDIASNYSTNKRDTSIEHESYNDWFKVRPEGARSNVTIDRLWYFLSAADRKRISEVLPHISDMDANGESTGVFKVTDDYALTDKGTWDYEIRVAHGNVIAAAVSLWLDGGTLFDQEEKFLDILELAGIKNVEFDSPNDTRSGVIPVYLSVQNPLDTSNIPQEIVDKLHEAGKRKRAKGGGPDMWGKANRSGAEWLQALDEDIQGGTTHAWTSIPDWVTKTLEENGYDGIKDLGGKNGGDTHTVWIPFHPSQVKSAYNRGTWDPRATNMARERQVDYSSLQDPQGWVYKAEALLKDKMQGPTPARQVLRMLRAAGVKEDELLWTGLNDFLNTDEKRTPQEVQEYLQANKLQINEIVHGKYVLLHHGQRIDAYSYQQYTLPGGENYREILFTLPTAEQKTTIKLDASFVASLGYTVEQYQRDSDIRKKVRAEYDAYLKKIGTYGKFGEKFTSPHWREPNVIAHTRIDDRTSADGKKMLFIEEVQSDWHQEGRRKGYDAPSGVPNAPFSKTWPEFVFKRLLRMAVENGYQAIGWTTGELQNERYDLSKKVDSIIYKANGDGTYRVSAQIQGRGQTLGEALTESQLEDNVGKDVAKKIVDGAGERINIGGNSTSQPSDYWQSLKGVDLKVGGEGMKGFYDKMLVDYANKYAKKWGVQTGEVELSTAVSDSGVDKPYLIINPDTQDVIAKFATEAEAKKWQEENDNWGDITYYPGDNITVHSLPINDAMRSTVLEGQYVFERASEKYGLDIDKGTYRQQMVKARQIQDLIAKNSGGFFNDEVEGFVVRTNAAIVKALEQARSVSQAFVTSADPNVRATLTPALNGSGMWDINLYKGEELVSTERFRSRAEAIVTLFTDTAPAFGGADTWSVSGEYVAPRPTVGKFTAAQQADLFEVENTGELAFEYDDENITLVYGNREAFDAANKAIQLSLFGDDEGAAGDLFAQNSDNETRTEQNGGKGEPPRRRRPLVSPMLGTEGDISHPAYVENRKKQRRISYVGQHVAGAQDIAKLFQVYRNSHIESFHLIYLDRDGNIVAHNAISSGVPGVTMAAERGDKTWYDRRDIILDRMQRLGADKLYILHNHPSGNPKPSPEDIGVTRNYTKYLGDKFAGHVIIDHDKASFISQSDYDKYNASRGIQNGADFIYSEAHYKAIANQVEQISYEPLPGSYNLSEGNKAVPIRNAELFAQMGSQIINSGTKNVLVVADDQLRVIMWSRLNSTDPETIYQMAYGVGGVNAFIATNDKFFFNEVGRNHVRAAAKDGGKYNILAHLILLDQSGHIRDELFNYGKDKELPNHYDYKTGHKDLAKRGAYVFDMARDAEEFNSYGEFRDAYVHEGDSEADIKAAWDESQKNRAGTPQEFLRRLMDNRALLSNFLEANGADLFDRRADKIHLGVVDAASYRLATGGVVPEATLNRALLLIAKNPDKWMDRYNQLSGMNTEYRDNFEIIGSGKNLTTLQAKYHDALSRLPDDQRQAILDGVTTDDIENVGALKFEVEKKRIELARYRSRLSYGERQIIDMIRESKRLDRELWTLRSKAKLSEVNRAQLHEKEAMKNEIDALVKNRLEALSPQSGLKNTAYIAAQDAYKKAKAEYQAKIDWENARRAERNLKLYFGRRIARPVAKNVDYKVAQQIIEMQKKLDPHFRQGGSMETSARSLDQWTLPELQQFYEEIEGVREYGRGVYMERQMEVEKRRSEIRSAFLQSIAKFAGSGRKPFAYGTTEQREQDKKDRNIFKDFDLSLETIHRLARELDGGVEGPFYHFLVEKERELFTAEKLKYDERVAAFDAKMAELKLDRDTMYREKVKLGDQTISKWEAIALYIGSKNPRTERAFVYGNLMSQEERDNLSDEALVQKGLENRAKIKDAVAQLSEEEIALAGWLIQEGVDNYDRFAEAIYEIDNRIPPKEDAYYPHERVMRSGEAETPQDAALNAMAKAGKPARGVNKAPSKNRVELSERRQSPITLDAYQVYRRGWERQEHIINYAQFITDFNAILKRGGKAGVMRERIRLAYGQPTLDYLDRWIAEAANPKAFADFNKSVRGFERVFRMMRGPLGIAYLGFRVSRGTFQLISSPAPYLPYAGEYMVRRMVLNLNPAEYMKALAFAKENSAFIRHRVINPVDAYIKDHIEKLPSKAQRAYYELAGSIMQFSDMWSVSTGWMAVYEKTAAKLKSSQLSADEIRQAAIKEADKVTIETQPTYRSQDLAPAFKMDSETWRFLLQFQTPLNVIYNQLFHDTRNDWKSGHKLRTIGIITGYLSVMGLMALITAPKPDDGDEDKRAKYFLSGIATAPLEALPLLGSVASGLVESAITGERYWRDDQIFPGVAKLVQGASRSFAATDKDMAEAAFLQLLEGAGMLAGAPTSAVKEYYRVLFEGDWGALIGRRP